MRHFFATILMCAAAAPVSAANFTVDLNETKAQVTSNLGVNPYSDLWVEVVAPSPGSFDIESGESYTFDFLEFSVDCDLWTFFCGDAELYTVEATLAFTTPEAFSVDGEGGGFAVTAKGNIVGGDLTWMNFPKTVTFADGSTATIDFQDLFGIAGEFGDGVIGSEKVRATATVAYNVSPVPLPAAGLMLAGVLSGMGYAAHRRRRF